MFFIGLMMTFMYLKQNVLYWPDDDLYVPETKCSSLA